MAITIGSNYVRSNTDLQMRVNNGTTVAVYQTNGIRYSNSRVPAFTASGQGGWYYSDQMGGDNAEWIDSNISGWTWQVSQQNAGSYGFSGGRYYAPVTGRYYFYASTYMYCNTNSTNCYMHFLLAKNGSPSFNNGRTPYSIYGHGTQNNYVDGCVHSTEIDLTQGQYVNIECRGQRSNSRTHGNHTLFCGALMG